MSDPRDRREGAPFGTERERREREDENLAVQGRPDEDEADLASEDDERLTAATSSLDNPDAGELDDEDDELDDGTEDDADGRAGAERRGYS